MEFRSLGSHEPRSTDKRCRCDRSHRESQLPVTRLVRASFHRLAGSIRSLSSYGPSSTDLWRPEAPLPALQAECGPAKIRHQDAVKNSRPVRYITDSKTAAKPSSGFTIHGRQAIGAPFVGRMLQTVEIELQNNLLSLLLDLAIYCSFLGRGFAP